MGVTSRHLSLSPSVWGSPSLSRCPVRLSASQLRPPVSLCPSLLWASCFLGISFPLRLCLPMAPSLSSVSFCPIPLSLSAPHPPRHGPSLLPSCPPHPMNLNQLTVHVPTGQGFPRAGGRELGAFNPSLSAAVGGGALGVSWASAWGGEACACEQRGPWQ